MTDHFQPLPRSVSSVPRPVAASCRGLPPPRPSADEVDLPVALRPHRLLRIGAAACRRRAISRRACSAGDLSTDRVAETAYRWKYLSCSWMSLSCSWTSLVYLERSLRDFRDESRLSLEEPRPRLLLEESLWSLEGLRRFLDGLRPCRSRAGGVIR